MGLLFGSIAFLKKVDVVKILMNSCLRSYHCFLRMHPIRIGWLAGCGNMLDMFDDGLNCSLSTKLEQGNN